MQSRSQNGGSNGSNNQHRQQGQGSSSGAGCSKDAGDEKQNGDKREGGSRRGGKRKRNNRPTPSGGGAGQSNGSAALGLPLGEISSPSSAEVGSAGLTE